VKKPLAARLRTYHRWVASAAVVILTWIAVTGLSLVIDLIFEPALPHAPVRQAVPAHAAIAALSEALDGTVRQTPPGATEIVLRMDQADGKPQVTSVAVSRGAENRYFKADPSGGWAEAGPPPAPQMSAYMQYRIRLHVLLEKLHRGNIIGLPGQTLSVLGGLSFLFLTLSGAWMYIDLLIKRRRLGRKALFWKA
jgi:uncharacterized iron-regulated membrane protein